MSYSDLVMKLGGIAARVGEYRAYVRGLAPIDLTTTTGLRVIRPLFTDDEQHLLEAVSQADRLGESARPIIEALRAAAERTVIEVVDVTTGGLLHTKTAEAALREVGADMVGAGDSFDASDISVVVTARSGNTGNGTILATTWGPTRTTRGVSLAAATEAQFVRSETWRVTCRGDVNRGFAPGNESFVIEPPRAYDNLERRWPGGSGGTHPINCTSSNVEESDLPGQNILVNSAFERAAVANTPDNWTARTGSFGTDIITTSTAWNGTQAIGLVGGGTNNPAIGQLLGATTGSRINLLPDTTYALVFQSRSNSGTINKEVTIQFADSGGTAIGLSGASTVVATSHTTSYSRTSGFIHTPANLQPGTYYLDIRNTGTALSGGETIYVDGVIVAPVVRVAPGSGGIVIVPGTTQFRTEDHFNVAWANDGAGLFMFYLDLLFDCYRRGIVFPVDTGGSETFADSLIA